MLRNILSTGLSILTIILCSCNSDGISEAIGGELPTNYIIIKDSSFSPMILKVVSGSSITFVNNTNTLHVIRTEDSVTISPVTIAPGSSYFFKKDTSGIFSYYCVSHPAARGSIEITP